MQKYTWVFFLVGRRGTAGIRQGHGKALAGTRRDKRGCGGFGFMHMKFMHMYAQTFNRSSLSDLRCCFGKNTGFSDPVCVFTGRFLVLCRQFRNILCSCVGLSMQNIWNKAVSAYSFFAALFHLRGSAVFSLQTRRQNPILRRISRVQRQENPPPTRLFSLFSLLYHTPPGRKRGRTAAPSSTAAVPASFSP